MDQSSTEGIVYVLSNPSFEDGDYGKRCLKIGMTQRDLSTRISELSNTSLPYPFYLVYAAKVANAFHVEKVLHQIFQFERLSKSREFFMLRTQQVVSCFGLIEHERVQIPASKEAVDAAERLYSNLSDELAAGFTSEIVERFSAQSDPGEF